MDDPPKGPASIDSERIEATVPIIDQNDILRARSAGREIARRIGFSTVDQTRIATAISELTRNALVYARGGVCTISTVSKEDQQMTIHVVVSDEGPGIPDISVALQPGFSTGRGLGQGLPAVRRLMHSLDINSGPTGTVIAATMSRNI